MFDQAILTVVVIKVFQKFQGYWHNLVISWKNTSSTFLGLASQPTALIFSNISAQMAGAFSQPGPWVRLFIGHKMTGRNQTYQNGRVSTYSDVQLGSANRQMSFSRQGNAWKNCPFQGTLPTSMAHSSVKHRRPHCKQDERSLLPCSAV